MTKKRGLSPMNSPSTIMYRRDGVPLGDSSAYVYRDVDLQTGEITETEKTENSGVTIGGEQKVYPSMADSHSSYFFLSKRSKHSRRERKVAYPDAVATTDGRPAEVEFYPEGSFIKARRHSLYRVRSAAPPPNKKRGVVAGFSHQSRTRLMQKLAKVKRSELPIFVTLTYPGVFPVHPDQWKKHMDIFAKRFARRFPRAGFIWKLEPQKRGAPHFHLLAWDAELTPVQFGAAMKVWVKRAWYEVVGSGDERHLRAGTGVEVVRSFQGVIYYASKYMSKPIQDEDAWGNPGRWWGVVGRDNIPYAERLATWIDTGDVNALIRWIKRFRKLPGRDCFSRWAIVESPNSWIDNLQRFSEIVNSVDPLAAKNFV